MLVFIDAFLDSKNQGFLKHWFCLIIFWYKRIMVECLWVFFIQATLLIITMNQAKFFLTGEQNNVKLYLDMLSNIVLTRKNKLESIIIII